MSERMIELQRARLLAASKGPKASVQPGVNPENGQGGVASRTILPGQAVAAGGHAMAAPQTPQQAATAAALSEDMEMKIFFERLQNHRDDSRAESTSGPTVPTALSRRMLQQQGVGYLDSTVGALASAMADRFLATILQQGIVCRDQRLKGAEIARETMRHRRRHMQQYEDDADDRRRRKEEKALRREKSNIAVIQAAESIKSKGGASKDALKDGETPGSSKSKKKKKPPQSDEAAKQANGNKPKLKDGFDDDEDNDDDESYDSGDQEEEYYQEHFSGDIADSDSDMDDDEEEDEEMMILRDLERPLEAWDFYVGGKQGVDPAADYIGEDEQDSGLDNLDDDDDGLGADDTQDSNGEGDGDAEQQKEDTTAVGVSTKSDARSPTDDNKKATQRRTAASPVPPSNATSK